MLKVALLKWKGQVGSIVLYLLILVAWLTEKLVFFLFACVD